MKKIYLLFVALLVITCAKEEDPIEWENRYILKVISSTKD